RGGVVLGTGPGESAAGTDAAADAARFPRTRTEDDPSTPLTPAAEADSPGSPVSSADSVSESTGSVPEFGESGLPKRRRGRTLAAAEARTGNAAPGEADTPRARTTDPKVQAARFSTFSKAVRANSPHPEGNTR
ncbi:ATP-binding protein, partial [Streptomyces sp. MBT61]|nr:ATP-binding protein [Streptomyces sp. MBT61]